MRFLLAMKMVRTKNRTMGRRLNLKSLKPPLKSLKPPLKSLKPPLKSLKSTRYIYIYIPTVYIIIIISPEYIYIPTVYNYISPGIYNNYDCSEERSAPGTPYTSAGP